ncbi:4-hydroxy-tetrahydrodipicolinate reductase [Lachnospiraceae bacterium OttesenSCG-928-E19]|nr:4-hydroxy-tetrahydrodipicolinate reductase [Lachnospiraceae bacterium OttesenSCG-928-E19]
MKVIIVGPKGKMGRLITQIAVERPEFEVIGAVGPKGRDYIGEDLGQVALVGKTLDVPVTDDLEMICGKTDVIIDFSTKEMAMEVLEHAVRHNKALVCGTTGFSVEEMERFKQAGEKIPVLYAANTSKLVNIMNKLLEITAKTVGEEMDIEILEMHDQWKRDVPSGTSKEMGTIMAEAMGKEMKDIAVYGREAGENPRKPGTIAYHSMRAGNLPSSHTVYFGGMGERLEITHHTYDWACFARGVCDCAAFLEGKEAGFYSIKDVLQL